MKKGLYIKLAWNGMKKNRRLYLPYIFTCIGMVMMFYIIAFLQVSPGLQLMKGAYNLRMILGFGKWVIGIFAAVFLFYTNSFLMKSRKKEFGLYNILGMGKKNISFILFWETIIEFVLSAGVGLGLGAAFSKIAELALMNILRTEINYDLSVSLETFAVTILIFFAIFLLILCNALRQLHTSDVIALLNSEKSGEKPPKANWILGILGLVLLAGAYDIAVSIENPLAAFSYFFLAVVMVMIGTYLLFVSGSVMLCKILQRKKKYYYKANHFISVSSMMYRMKRNGAGLASICILGTMVLVMISGSACLYFGSEDSLHTRYPRDIAVKAELKSLEGMEDENIDLLRQNVSQVLKDNHEIAENLLDYRYVFTMGFLDGDKINTDEHALDEFSMQMYEKLFQIYIISLADYNRMTGENAQLSGDEVMLFTRHLELWDDTISFYEGGTFRVAAHLTEIFDDAGIAAIFMDDVMPTMFVVVSDYGTAVPMMLDLSENNGMLRWYYGFDSDAKEETQNQIFEQMQSVFGELQNHGEGGLESYRCESLENNREDYYVSDGSIFFLGIILSIVFIVAAVLIIYYKQISEGCEDESRFAIMQKVGMTKRDIRRSINSQMLTVFFLPLFMAVVHLAFACPAIYRMLTMFNLSNKPLLLATTGVSILVFAGEICAKKDSFAQISFTNKTE